MAQSSQLGSYEAEQAALEDVVRHADAGGYRQLAFAARRALANAYDVGRQRDKGVLRADRKRGVKNNL